MTLSKEIKAVRQKAFLTQIQFGEQLNVSSLTVNRWETGKSRPHLKAMKELKGFCANNGIEYKALEDAWLRSKLQNGDNNDGD